jgi:hypothetical protein
MVVDECGVLQSDSLIYPFIAVSIVIKGLPHKVALLDALGLLRVLLPVATSYQCLRHSLRVVPSMHIEEEFFLLLLGCHPIGILLQHLVRSRTYLWLTNLFQSDLLKLNDRLLRPLHLR